MAGPELLRVEDSVYDNPCKMGDRLPRWNALENRINNNNSIRKKQLTIGLLCATGVLCIWSGFVVFSRAGVVSDLTAFDLAALRLIVAGSLAAPFVYMWWPRNLPLRVVLLMSICGPGALYTVLIGLGLSDSSAAYGGVFANGSLPIFVLLLGLLVNRVLPDRHQVVAVAIITLGAFFVGFPGLQLGGANVLLSIVFFLVGSAVLSVFIFGINHWKVTPRQALALTALPNALVYLPLWYFFLPSTIQSAEWQTILFQALFQGAGPGFIAIFLFTITITTLGSTVSSAIAASVPASAALLAIPVLSEYPQGIVWVGIVVVTGGLLMLVFRPFDGASR